MTIYHNDLDYGVPAISYPIISYIASVCVVAIYAFAVRRLDMYTYTSWLKIFEDKEPAAKPQTPARSRVWRFAAAFSGRSPEERAVAQMSFGFPPRNRDDDDDDEESEFPGEIFL
ncbi:hypothetical protein GP486_006048, partial [Trichoglossum hirsutum]